MQLCCCVLNKAALGMLTFRSQKIDSLLKKWKFPGTSINLVIHTTIWAIRKKRWYCIDWHERCVLYYLLSKLTRAEPVRCTRFQARNSKICKYNKTVTYYTYANYFYKQQNHYIPLIDTSLQFSNLSYLLWHHITLRNFIRCIKTRTTFFS